MEKGQKRAAHAARFSVQFFWRSLPKEEVKFLYLRLWRHREPAAVNLSFYAFAWNPFRAKQMKVHFGYFVQRDQHGII